MSAKLEIQIKSVVKEIKALDAKLTKLIKKVESAGKATPAQKTAPKKKTMAKKTVKKAAQKKTEAKKTSAKKDNGSPTAYQTIIGIVAMSNNGITNSELMEKTGFDKKKIANILFKAKKKGILKTEKKGVYVKA